MTDLVHALTIAGIAILWGYTLEPGQIFGKIGNAIRKLPEWAFKPLGICPVCSGVWVAIIYSLCIAETMHQAILFVAVSHILIRLILNNA